MAQSGRQGANRDFIAKTHATSYPFISPLALDLTGRFVLVTGAACEDGVGYATALGFAKAGASGIALADMHKVAPALISRLQTAAVEAGRQEPVVVSAKVDISNLHSVEAFQKEVASAFDNRLDLLANNAAHQEPYKSILDSNPDTY